MRYGLDTSVIVRLLSGEPAELCTLARDRLLAAQRARHTVYATDVSLVEAYVAMKYHYAKEPAEIRMALRKMLESGLVEPEPGSGIFAALVDRPGTAGFIDRIIHERHRELGATTLTLDERQAKLPGAEGLIAAPRKRGH